VAVFVVYPVVAFFRGWVSHGGSLTNGKSARNGCIPMLCLSNEDTLRKVDAHDGKRRWETHVAHSPQAVTVGAGSVWVASIGRWHKGRGGVVVTDGPGIVSRLDPETGTVVAEIAVGSDASAIAVGAGSVWVLSGRNQHSPISSIASTQG